MANESSAKPANRRSLSEHALTMPRSHKSLLTMALVFLTAGLVGQGASWFSSGSISPQAVQTTPPADGDAQRSLVSGTQSTNEDSTSADSTESTDQPLWQRMSPWSTRIGIVFIAGFVIGWAFRAFLKLMSMFAGLGLMVVLALSYFGVLNVDMTTARREYNSAITWVTDQAERFGKMILNHVGGSASSFVGMFIGFKRK